MGYRIEKSRAWQDKNKKWVTGYSCGWCGCRFDELQKKRKAQWEYTACPACGWEDCKCVDSPAHFNKLY